MEPGKVVIAETNLGTIKEGDKLHVIRFVNDRLVLERLEDSKKFHVRKSNWHKFTELENGEVIIRKKVGRIPKQKPRNERNGLKPHDIIIRDIEDIINRVGEYKVTRSGEGHMFFLEGNVYFQPDIVLRKGGSISHIIEVESNIIGKSTIGAVMQADYVVRDKQNKVNLIFVVVRNPGKPPTPERIEQFKARLKTTKHYTKWINLFVVKEEEINEENLNRIINEDKKWGRVPFVGEI